MKIIDVRGMEELDERGEIGGHQSSLDLGRHGDKADTEMFNILSYSLYITLYRGLIRKIHA